VAPRKSTKRPLEWRSCLDGCCQVGTPPRRRPQLATHCIPLTTKLRPDCVCPPMRTSQTFRYVWPGTKFIRTLINRHLAAAPGACRLAMPGIGLPRSPAALQAPAPMPGGHRNVSALIAPAVSRLSRPARRKLGVCSPRSRREIEALLTPTAAASASIDNRWSSRQERNGCALSAAGRPRRGLTWRAAPEERGRRHAEIFSGKLSTGSDAGRTRRTSRRCVGRFPAIPALCQRGSRLSATGIRPRS
jgi:hypothetical protein